MFCTQTLCLWPGPGASFKLMVLRCGLMKMTLAESAWVSVWQNWIRTLALVFWIPHLGEIVEFKFLSLQRRKEQSFLTDKRQRGQGLYGLLLIMAFQVWDLTSSSKCKVTTLYLAKQQCLDYPSLKASSSRVFPEEKSISPCTLQLAKSGSHLRKRVVLWDNRP